MAKVIKTPEERLFIYEKLLSRFLDVSQESAERNVYPYGLCAYLSASLAPNAYTDACEVFPELRKVKPIFASKDGFWWPIYNKRGYQERLKAINKMIKLVKKQINDSQTTSTMVSGATS